MRDTYLGQTASIALSGWAGIRRRRTQRGAMRAIQALAPAFARRQSRILLTEARRASAHRRCRSADADPST